MKKPVKLRRPKISAETRKKMSDARRRHWDVYFRRHPEKYEQIQLGGEKLWRIKDPPGER